MDKNRRLFRKDKYKEIKMNSIDFLKKTKYNKSMKNELIIKRLIQDYISDIKRTSSIEKYVKEDDTHEQENKKIVYSFAAGMSYLLTIINIVKKIPDMALSTFLMGTGMFVAIAVNKFAYKKDNRKFKDSGDIIITFVAACILCYWMLSGQNGGFAVLWMLVAVPVISVINRAVGMALATFLLIFNMCCCWVPEIRITLEPFYNSFFLDRFPLLYLTNFLIVFYIVIERDKNNRNLLLKTYFDDLTLAPNRRFYLKLIKYYKEKQKNNSIVVFVADLNGLKNCNDTLGHEAGDVLIKGGVECLEKAIPKAITICRVGGDEYAGVVSRIDFDIEKTKKDLKAITEEWSKQHGLNLSISIGFVDWSKEKNTEFEEIYAKADKLMYKEKTEYYLENHIERRKNIKDRRKRKEDV